MKVRLEGVNRLCDDNEIKKIAEAGFSTEGNRESLIVEIFTLEDLLRLSKLVRCPLVFNYDDDKNKSPLLVVIYDDYF